MPEVPVEQRRAARMPCDFRVVVMVQPGIFGPGVLLNVSSSGALLQTPMVLSPQTQIELEVEGPAFRRSSIVGSITRRELNQYGVIFRRPANSTVIDKIVRLAQSQPQAVNA